MKKSILIAVLMIALTAASCGRKNTENDLLAVNKKNKTEVVQEKYSGTLPAADGPGIVYEVTLLHYDGKDSGIYHMRNTYIEGENGRDVAFDEYGDFIVTRRSADRILRLTPFNENQDVTSFIKDGDASITLLDAQMNRIQSNLNYTLKSVK